MIRELWLKFKRFYLPYPLSFIGKYGVKAILMTCKIEVNGLKQFKETALSKKCILLLWHNRIFVVCEFFKDYLPGISYTAFLSKSRDGEPIAKVLDRYHGASYIRVAHDMRHHALRSMISRLNESSDEVVIVTPDGPKGPRYKVKPGVIHAAKETGAGIVPFTWKADRYWQLKTWDLFQIPKPFSKISITIGNPIFIDKDSDGNEAAQQLEQALKSGL